MAIKHQYHLDKDVFYVIHVDDDILELRSFARNLQVNKNNLKFAITSCLNGTEFKNSLTKLKFVDFVILDIHLSEKENITGISLVKEVKKFHPNAIILMSSNLDDPSTILQSLRAGADEFISKKMNNQNLVEKLLLVRTTIFNKRGIIFLNKKDENLSKKFSGETIKKISRRIPQIVHSAITSVYIEGESGTGKEVVAELFEDYIKELPFVKMNCGSIAPNLVESELFGYVKGSFTGALNNKVGLLEAASGGWLFLDEVASLSDSAQIALLRAIENQEVTRIGDSVARKINVRFIAASNVSLSEMVQEGKFRNDLWQRLCETEILLMPLRERRNEIPDLIYFFCRTMRGGPYQIEETALNVLCQLPWFEGNVRELRNCLRAMTEHHVNKILTPLGIPERILMKSKDNYYSLNNKIENVGYIKLFYKNKSGEYYKFEELEVQLFEKIFELFNSTNKKSISEFSKTFGLARSTVQIKIKKMNQQ
ncbi:sigma 54-interacting transcriptional regulator [Pigmentibacter sp. JX0631]|uniref:sigma-54-dependent transcriptional regulator n=1 Tax=Pigmentibacter sp. JX0631 TaxID=2976982 RepID=UPI002468F089|nr:sigma 54-interacting transcriptional regulator [Pigmentibacter sp. JX0631]WGL59248.1 sigma 54-interacting transcriptional regulator [Pigmentibacter sp. JX0631]